jgi:Transcriptional regulator
VLAIIKLIHISGLEENMSTKEKILEAALSLFAENGYDGTSVEQIAGIVGIKAPSLYKHYKGKEDIVV